METWLSEKIKILIGFDFLIQNEFNQYSKAYVRHYYSRLGELYDITYIKNYGS